MLKRPITRLELAIVLVLLIAAGLYAIQVNALYDFIEIAAPANPAANNDRLYADSTSHTIKCLTSTGGSCISAGGGTLSISGFDVTDGVSFWGPVFSLVRPIPANFTNFNFAGTGITGTLTTTNGIFSLREQGSSTTGQIMGTTSAIIAATFTMTAAIAAVSNQVTDNQFGICVTDGTKFVVMAVQWFNGSLFLNVSDYTNATTFSADEQVRTTPLLFGPLIFFRVQETATNRIWSISTDGRSFSTVLSTANTQFLTSTRYGIFLRGDNSAADSSMALYSFLESNP